MSINLVFQSNLFHATIKNLVLWLTLKTFIFWHKKSFKRNRKSLFWLHLEFKWQKFPLQLLPMQLQINHSSAQKPSLLSSPVSLHSTGGPDGNNQQEKWEGNQAPMESFLQQIDALVGNKGSSLQVNVLLLTLSALRPYNGLDWKFDFFLFQLIIHWFVLQARRQNPPSFQIHAGTALRMLCRWWGLGWFWHREIPLPISVQRKKGKHERNREGETASLQ